MNKYLEVLKAYWNYDSFRPLQQEIIEAAGAGSDTLALMPTGGGKSITFQVPALAKEGICLVLTPLIALMKDQVAHLHARGIKAMAIHSGMTRDEISVALDNCVFGDFKFLYLSPERLNTEIFKVRVQQMNVNLVAIDEAHCISQWGYDFRPSYLKIAELRKLIPDVPFLALTATATSKVAEDIMERLDFKDPIVFRKSFERKNLSYVVRKTEDKPKELVKIVKKIKGSGIVYVRNRRNTREIADLLKKEGISAEFYHAGLPFDTRMKRQEAWQEDSIRIIVSTNAFGMGIDKAGVRLVIHMDLPDSPEAYFQEAGRAGRDEDQAWAILLYSDADERKIKQRIEVNFPNFDEIRAIYRAVFNYLQVPEGGGKGSSFDFILGEFLSRYKFNAMVVTSALDILSREGYFDITEEINNPSRIHFTSSRDALYRFQGANPKFEEFIRLLLRSYTGLFSQYVAFDEHTVARRAQMRIEEVYSYLSKLSSMGIISYVPKKRNPVITLHEERLKDKNIHLSAERFKFRKERYIERASKVLEYAQSTHICRSQFLLRYFDEKQTKACGQCDVCRSRRKSTSDHQDQKKTEEQILSLLRKEALPLSGIIKELEGDEDAVSKLVSYLMEEKRILRKGDMKFYLAE